MAIVIHRLDRTQAAGDRAGPEFWERWWQRTALPAPIEPLRAGLKNYPYRSFHRFFEGIFGERPSSNRRLIEIGCAQSAFLPYFGRYFGFQVTGLDRSELGCRRARQLLDREKVRGEVVQADLFVPPAELLGTFDVAFSFGVIEHFDDTRAALGAVAAYVKPGGTTLAVIPNFTGILGLYQRLLDRRVYDCHLVMDAEKLAESHRQAGLDVVLKCYLMPLNLEVMNLGCWRNRRAARIIDRAHTAASRLAWFADEHLFRWPPNRWTSPYIACAARKVG